MTPQSREPAVLSPIRDQQTPLRFAQSALARGEEMLLADFHRWFTDFAHRAYTNVDRIPLDRLDRWKRDEQTGNIHHDSGKFFTVEGLDVHIPGGPVSRWRQPIINQPEIGILGLLVKEFDGVLHCLMQAKVEPGNRNGLQLSPTVQATRSNYTQVHRGKPVPYLEYFRDSGRHHVIADVRQSEQGAWFSQKRNRNIVVEVDGDVELLDGFRWVTLGQVHELLAAEDLINMDARTVLSCLPLAGADLDTVLRPNGDRFHAALIRSCHEAAGSAHTTGEILSWITEARTRTDVHTRRIPLNEVSGWKRTEERISHESGCFFSVIGVKVTAGGREVAGWTQPMIEPHGLGVVGLLVRDIGGVLHALMHARVEPGYLDVVELAPSVQCIPESYRILPADAQPPFLDEILSATPDRIKYDTILSEEGGRFYHALNRYLIVETDADTTLEHPDFRWIALHQLVALLQHSHYLNVQARSLVACVHSLLGAGPKM